MRVTGIVYPPEASYDLMGLRGLFCSFCGESLYHFYAPSPRAPAGWFYADLRGYVVICEKILAQATEQSLSEEEQLWLDALVAFHKFAKETTANIPADRRSMPVIQGFVDHMKALILGPLKKPESGTPADWEARPRVSWETWNRWSDPQAMLVEASETYYVQGSQGIWRPYGMVEGED